MATPPPSRFAALLRRSKFASFDPHIGQVYTTYDGHAARGNFGLKRPLAVRRRNAHITVQAVDSREQQTVWRSAESENRWIRMWDEVGVTPRVGTTTPWAERLGSVGLEIDFPVDSEFSTEDKQEASSAVDQGVAVVGEKDAVGGGQAERRSHALPNFEAMSEKEFERYLAYLRTLRPAFLEFVAKKRKVSLETQSLFRLATNAGDDFKEFLATHAYKEYHQPRPRYIEQQPHRFAGLSYTHAPAVQTLYTTKSHIGRVLTEEIKDAHWVAETAGMVSKLAKGDRGEDQSKVAAFRLNPTARLRHVPQTVGHRPEGMEAVALNVDVRIADSPGVAHARTNPHVPGSPEYVGQRIHRAPDGMTTPPVHTRIESFTYRGDIAAENLLKALQSSIPSPPNP